MRAPQRKGRPGGQGRDGTDRPPPRPPGRSPAPILGGGGGRRVQSPPRTEAQGCRRPAPFPPPRCPVPSPPPRPDCRRLSRRVPGERRFKIGICRARGMSPSPPPPLPPGGRMEFCAFSGSGEDIHRCK